MWIAVDSVLVLVSASGSDMLIILVSRWCCQAAE